MQSNFKMRATTKYLLSTITDPVARNIFKKNMVAAQIVSEQKLASKDGK